MSSSNKRAVFEELIDEVRRSQNATDRFDQAVADALGLNRTDMRCLDVLEREGAVTAGRLAEATGLTSGAMTTALDRLERAGYAERVRDVQDRRRVLVTLTRSAHEDAGSYYAQHAALSEQLYQRYSTDQLEMLLAFVRRGREFNEARAAEVEAALREREGRAEKRTRKRAQRTARRAGGA
jgi:DNA-binding MarR family transcriptional regulator